MIPFDEALKIVLQNARLMELESGPAGGDVGKILAQDVRSICNMPPFDKSAVDGFACRRDDLGQADGRTGGQADGRTSGQADDPGSRIADRASLTVIETIPAGKVPEQVVGEGQCARIMTGAMVPEGADTVIMVEHTREVGPDQIRFTGTSTASNICYRAEDIREGEPVLQQGTLITPAVMALLAATAPFSLNICKTPSVAVISTGDELVDTTKIPRGAQIRDSNSTQLYAWLQWLRFDVISYGIVPDNPKLLLKELNDALENHDVVILSGGVSMGDFDFVPEVMQKAGVEILFKSVAIQPGRPTVFGRKKTREINSPASHEDPHMYDQYPHGDRFVFGLPGNPVSSFVLFEMLVKPFLYKMMGHDYQPLRIPLPMGETYRRKPSNRMNILPVAIRNGQVFPIPYHGSAHIHAYVQADGMIALQPGTTEIKQGEPIDVRLL